MSWRKNVEYFVRLEERKLERERDRAARALRRGVDLVAISLVAIRTHQVRLAIWRQIERRAAEIEADEEIL